MCAYRSFVISAIVFLLSSCSAIPALSARPFRAAFIGDPQVNDSVEMEYARRSVYKELAARKDIDLCIFLGDLVNDNMELLRETKGIIDSLPFPCLCIPGNHDRDTYRDGVHAEKNIWKGCSPNLAGSPDHRRGLVFWKRTFGYIDTSFVHGGLRFILMNNVRAASRGMADYEGGFSEAQKHWLDSLLNMGASLYVLVTHIPFSQTKGRDSVSAMIPDMSRMLFVSGHTHSVARHCISAEGLPASSEQACELIAGATCGSWWRGVKDAEGVPYALQNCGSPRGYFIADFRNGGKYSLEYKCIGGPSFRKASVHADSSGVIVNVFGGAEEGAVVLRTGCSRTRCTRYSDTAPEVGEIIDYNSSASREYRRAHRDEFIPLRHKDSPHLWRGEGVRIKPGRKIVVRYRDAHSRFRQTFPPVQEY